jgi:fucose 4-O-acetylase-like acetyltransferase
VACAFAVCLRLCFFTGILAFHAFEEGRMSAKLLLSFIHTPYYHLWFIPTLVLWVLAFAALVKLRIPIVYVLAFFLVLSVLWATLPKEAQWELLVPLLSKKVVYFFSFFLFGAWLRTTGSRKLRTLFSQFTILPMVLITACAGLYLINIGADKSLLKAIVWLILNLALLTLLLASATSNTSTKPSFVANMGRNSLPIYLWHMLPMFILKGFDIHQTNTLVYYFVASISMVLIVFVILQLEGRNKWLNRYVYGAA